MNDEFQKLAAQRRMFLDGIDANQGDINLDIFEDFYPDQAHFVYELLQNAEDAGATRATFILTCEGCSIEHNGSRTFSLEDIKAITGIHNSTKSKSADQIGKFGVGFKSVFVYTLAPQIYSGEFSFQISRLVMPELIDSDPKLGINTRFWLPFNNPKKSPGQAYKEVENGLSKLAETTLLFLTNLESISWRIGDDVTGEVLRYHHHDNHIEVLKHVGGETTTSQHFLKFQQSVERLEKQQVSIAFELKLLSDHSPFDPEKPLAEQMKIEAAEPGRVAIFFPAEKETSGLRFHLHAPFVPELSRASIKETDANKPLFEQLASLASASLHTIRDLGLLTGDFLSVLPNSEDNLSPNYEPIWEAIIEEMKEQSLTPTYSKKHAPAKYLIQAKNSLKQLLSKKDIKCLVLYDDEPKQWAIAATQRNNNVDRFLSDLKIKRWDINDFEQLLIDNKESVAKWLIEKPNAWIQQMYAMLNDELGYFLKEALRNAKIVKLTGGSFGVGSNSFFPDESASDDEEVPRVDAGVYTSGKSSSEQKKAKSFLGDIGVRIADEAALVENILKKRYSIDTEVPDDETYLNDFKRFVTFVEKFPGKSSLFEEYNIFETERGKWDTPRGIFLDEPYKDTGLRAYFDNFCNARTIDSNYESFLKLTSNPPKSLSKRYERIEVDNEKVVKFAEKVGVITSLNPCKTTCKKNPDWEEIDKETGARRTSGNIIDVDYHIPLLENLLKNSNVDLSRLVWKTMMDISSNIEFLEAVYRKNEKIKKVIKDSQLVHLLRDAAWIPQDDKFVRPEEASPNLLPAGFTYDPGWEWLKKINFGQNNAKKKKEEQDRKKLEAAKELGFPDLDSMERAKRFAAIPPAEQERFLKEMERRDVSELPDHEPSNPARRAERVSAMAAEAPERRTEECIRSVSVGLEDVKVEAKQYLLQQYTVNGHLICQLCQKRMPFQKDDGSEYFEKVELFTQLKNRHYQQNYLALCPNHAAMYQHVNGSKDQMLDLFSKITENYLEVILARQENKIYFTKTHIADLQTVIKTEAASSDKNDEK